VLKDRLFVVLNIKADPKSMSFTSVIFSPSKVIRILSDFTSAWIIPLCWRRSKASKILTKNCLRIDLFSLIL